MRRCFVRCRVSGGGRRTSYFWLKPDGTIILLTVAHFRRILFNRTETFLYNYLTSFQRIKTVAITFQKAHLNSFPYTRPIVELYSWTPWCEFYRRVKSRLISSELTYDLPSTYQALKSYKARILHAHFGYTGAQVLSVKRKTGLPLVTTFYGEDVSALANTEKWYQAYQQLFVAGDLFLVEGSHMRQRLIGIGCPPEKIAIQRIAILLDRYPFRERPPKASHESVHILFCGSFREKKGLLYALEAVRRAAEVYPNITFRIIGDGQLRPQVEHIIDRYHMQSYTTLLGFRSHEDMIREMQLADIFIHPSVTAANGDSEGGAPTTILEAQACGLPVLSTMHADIPNIVIPGGSALLAAERDVEALSSHLCTLIKEPERWREMGLKGRVWVEHNHAIGPAVARLEDHYFALQQASASLEKNP